MGGPSSCPAGCQAPVIAFPALSPHSRAHDVFWVSVCLLSEAKPTFLNSHCSVHAEESKGPSLLRGEGGDPAPPTFSFLVILTSWVFNTPLSPSGPVSPKAPLPRSPPTIHLPHGDFHARVGSMGSSPAPLPPPVTLKVAQASPPSHLRGWSCLWSKSRLQADSGFQKGL